MPPQSDASPSMLARALLRKRGEGALATLDASSGNPYSSLVNLASHWDGSPILLISRLAPHTRNILADPRVSLMLDARSDGDSLQGARITLAGRAIEATANEVPGLRRRYLNAHPSAEIFVDFADFSFFRIEPDGAHLVAGFGRIVDLTPDQLLTDLVGAEALIDAEQNAIDHMNADHADAMALYATHLLGASDADWRCIGIDPDGLDMRSKAGALRLEFPQRTTTPAALRKVLKSLADDARRRAKS